MNRHVDVTSDRTLTVGTGTSRPGGIASSAPPSGLAMVGPAAAAKLTGRLPSSVTLLTLKSSGAVQVSSASQLAVASMRDAGGEPASEVVVGERLQERRVDVGAIVGAAHRPDLVEERADRPLAGLCQGDDRRAEAELLASRASRSCAAGSRNTGPTPQMMRPGLRGREERGRDDVAEAVDARRRRAVGCDVSGMMTRRMMFVLLLMPNGMTGWMLSSVPVASRSPMPKSQLPCSGTLIRLATGFCVCLASSSALCAAAGPAASPGCARPAIRNVHGRRLHGRPPCQRRRRGAAGRDAHRCGCRRRLRDSPRRGGRIAR